MGTGVIDQPHIHMLEGHIEMESIFLYGLGVDDHDLQPPHHQNASHHHLITLEPWVQQLQKIHLIAKGTTMGSSWVSHPIGSSQDGFHVLHHLLTVVYHPVHYLMSKVAIGIVWELATLVLVSTQPAMLHLQALLCSSKEAISIAIKL